MPLDNPIFLVNLENLEEVKIQFVPYEMQMNDTSEWVGQNSPGRNHPFYFYTGGEDTLTFTLDWCSFEEDRLDVIKKCKWVKALSRSDGYTNPPPRVKLVWGTTLFSDAIWVVTAAPYKFTMFNADKDMLPVQAYQELTLKRVVDHNQSSLELLNIRN